MHCLVFHTSGPAFSAPPPVSPSPERPQQLESHPGFIHKLCFDIASCQGKLRGYKKHTAIMSKNSLKRRRSGELGASTVESDGHLTSDPSAAIGGMASDSDDAQSEKPVLKRQKIPFRQVRNMDNFLISGMSGAEVYYLPSFVSPEKAKEWYSGLLDLDCMSPYLFLGLG